MSFKKRFENFPYGFYILRGLGILLLFVLIKSLTSAITMLIYTTSRGEFDFFKEWAL